MKNVPVSHAILVSKEDKRVFLEKNARYDGKLTFFGGKVEEGENKVEAIIRELKEETGVELLPDDLIELIGNDELVIGDKMFIGTIYIVIVGRFHISQILSNDRNIGLSFNSVLLGNYAFPDIYDKIKKAFEKLGI